MTRVRTADTHSARRTLRRALLVLLALPFAYLLGAVIGSIVPRNPDWKEPRQGVLIFVRSNGIHADVVLPARAAGFDLYRLVPPAHVADPRSAGGWVAFGWGQREFYLETPRWADLSARNAGRAIFGGDALMHVEHLARPKPSANMRPLRLDPQAYRKLVAAVEEGFALDAAGRPTPLLGRGYAANDVFYAADGRYNAFRTSNQWTADALARAGVEVGVWAPFAQGVLWRFRDGAGN